MCQVRQKWSEKFLRLFFRPERFMSRGSRPETCQVRRNWIEDFFSSLFEIYDSRVGTGRFSGGSILVMLCK
jgi:hypothetical protein